MFICNDMDRVLYIAKPRSMRGDGDKASAISKSGNIEVLPGVINQVEVPDDEWQQIAKNNRALEAQIATGRVRVGKRKIANEVQVVETSGDATPPEELEDTRNAKKGKVKHKSKAVEAVEVAGSDDAPEGGTK